MTSCVLTVIKDEHIYLDEFIQYYLSIGIDHIIIGEDTDSITHKDIIDKYNNVTLYNVLDFFSDEKMKNKSIFLKTHGVSPQESYLYNGLIYIKYHYDFDWCFVIDIDEFVTFDNKYKNINEVLSLYKDYDSVILQWQNFGANGLIYRPDYNQKGIIETYTKCCNFTRKDEYLWFRNVKSVHHLNNYTKNSYNSGHVPNLKTNWCRTNFSKDIKNLIYDTMYIRHYITKSWEEYVIKLNVRGMFNRQHRNYEDFFDLNPDMKDNKKELLKIADNIILNNINKKEGN